MVAARVQSAPLAAQEVNLGTPPIVDRIATTGFDQRGDLHTGGDGLDERSADTGFPRWPKKNAFFCSIYGDIIHA